MSCFHFFVVVIELCCSDNVFGVCSPVLVLVKALLVGFDFHQHRPCLEVVETMWSPRLNGVCLVLVSAFCFCSWSGHYFCLWEKSYTVHENRILWMNQALLHLIHSMHKVTYTKSVLWIYFFSSWAPSLLKLLHIFNHCSIVLQQCLVYMRKIGVCIHYNETVLFVTMAQICFDFLPDLYRYFLA